MVQVLFYHLLRLVCGLEFLLQLANNQFFGDILKYHDDNQMTAFFIDSVHRLRSIFLLDDNLVFNLKSILVKFNRLIRPPFERRVCLQGLEVVKLHFSQVKGPVVRPGQFVAVLGVEFDASGLNIQGFF